MVNNRPALDHVFGALADSTRRDMIQRLSQGPATIGELGEPFGITKGAVTKHIKVLERAGLLRRDIQGRVHRCEIDTLPLEVVQRWVDQVRTFWEERFDDLSEYLDELQNKGKHDRRRKTRTRGKENRS